MSETSSDEITRIREVAKAAIKQILDISEQHQRNALFYERILRQAILTNGGFLPVDPQFAEEAKRYENDLELGNGLVTFYGSPHSLFPGKKP